MGLAFSPPEESAICFCAADVDFGNIRSSAPSETISFHKDGATKAQTTVPFRPSVQSHVILACELNTWSKCHRSFSGVNSTDFGH
jgi:hypothetical protein